MKMKTLAALLATAFLSLPAAASADFVDVIESTLNDGCDMDKYLAIVNDFNAYYKDKGYQTEILLPVHAEEADGTIFWIGRSSNATTFGQAFDHWEVEVDKSGSAVNKLSDRFVECTTNVRRASYQNP